MKKVNPEKVRIDNLKQVLLKEGLPQEIQAYMYAEIVEQFDAADSHGSFSRDVRWAGFANQYRRKDGTIIPAWGGVDRAVIRGKDGEFVRLGRWVGDNRPNAARTAKARKKKENKNKVLGRLRAHHQGGIRRVKESDKPMNLSGKLRNSVVSRLLIKGDKIYLVTPAEGKDYRVYQERKRRFNYFTQKDIKQITEMTARRLQNGFL
jgi:hypothetical protein